MGKVYKLCVGSHPDPKLRYGSGWEPTSLKTQFAPKVQMNNQFNSFRIRVSAELIEKASRFFNASLRDIVIELLQNARRAKATKLFVGYATIDDTTWLEFEDDGEGIFRNGISLALGASYWKPETRDREDPAGCGIFALAQRGCIIESFGRKIVLTEEHFCGRKDVAIENTSVLNGTRICFPLLPNEIDRVSNRFADCALHYPLPVYLTGKQLPQKDFLADALYRETWSGLQIGVFDTNWRTFINFYGLVVEDYLPKVKLHPHRSLTVKIDVVNCPQLQLVLPARKEIVQNDFYQMLIEECFRVMFRYVATIGAHRLSYQDWRKAADLGIILPEAEPILACYVPTIAHWDDREMGEEESVGEKALIVEPAANPALEQTFGRALELESNRSELQLFAADDNYQGYSWYDRIPVLNDLSIEVHNDSEKLPIEQAAARFTKDRCDRIYLIGTIRHPNAPAKSYCLLADLALWRSDCYCTWFEDANIFIAKDSLVNVEELVEILRRAFFEPSDDSDSDSWETQREDFYEEAYEIAATALTNQQDALTMRLQLIVERHLAFLLPDKKTLQVRRNASGKVQIELT